ncbi:hypothetical protein P3T76_004428 [Phytophthora citrophthora]|uniref:Uncharacterized protein n=1 Tax=Phytophthora citrophthora TaxID=4793 RepID=A0AAD9GU11_9STRA|nr:hypothetical protein P3T76_004428 [Phytophthora citrophthora]
MLDVEQQLLCTTEVVQLHLSLTNAYVSSKNKSEVDFAEETEILELIDRVERAKRGLQNVTTQLLVLAECCTTVKNNEEYNKKPEEEGEEGEQMNRSSLEKYTAAAKNAVKMVVDPEDVETLETWRRIVEVDALDANRQFLDLLSDGKADEEGAEAFTKTTLFAVSVLTSYQAKSQKPSWLMQLVEDLTDIENAAKESKFAKVLAPVEKCRDDLVAYCSLNGCDTLEGMLNYVILIERHRGVQTNRLLPYMLTLLRRQDVVGEDPLMDSEWLQFNECSKVGALLVSSHFREFEIRFPGRLTAELHENWCQIIGDVGQQQIDDYAAKLESLDLTNYDELLRGDKEIFISETTPVPIKEIPASETNPVHVPDTKFINTTVPVHQMGPLKKFVSNARDFQSKLESFVPKPPVVEKQHKDLIARFLRNMANSL